MNFFFDNIPYYKNPICLSMGGANLNFLFDHKLSGFYMTQDFQDLKKKNF